MKAEIYERRESCFSEVTVTVLDNANYIELKDGFVEIGEKTRDALFGSCMTQPRGLFAADCVLRVIMSEQPNKT